MCAGIWHASAGTAGSSRQAEPSFELVQSSCLHLLLLRLSLAVVSIAVRAFMCIVKQAAAAAAALLSSSPPRVRFAVQVIGYRGRQTKRVLELCSR